MSEEFLNANAGIPTNSGFSLRANWFKQDNASTSTSTDQMEQPLLVN
jgi:hypothetical protein